MASARLESPLIGNAVYQDKPESDEIAFLKKLHHDQKFWKYHVLKTGLYQFYFTTNPDERHKYIRKAPSYTVTYSSQAKNQYSLTFIRQTFHSTGADEDHAESFIVYRDASGNFKVSGVVSQYISTTSVSNLKLLKSIPQRPSESIMVAKKDQSRSKWLRNTEIMFDDQVKYSVTHPGWGACQLGSLVNKGNTFSKLINSADDNMVAPLGERSVYLFKDHSRKRSASVWYDGLVSFFRPCKRNVMNKLSYNMKHLKLNNRFSNSVGVTQETYEDEDEDIGDFDTEETQDTQNGSSSKVSVTKRNSGSSIYHSSENNMSGNYYTAKDGLFHKQSKDDSPSDFKFGWVTIFDNEVENFANPNGNWETVLGLTFAVGFERNLQDYLSKEKEQLL